MEPQLQDSWRIGFIGFIGTVSQFGSIWIDFIGFIGTVSQFGNIWMSFTSFSKGFHCVLIANNPASHPVFA